MSFSGFSGFNLNCCGIAEGLGIYVLQFKHNDIRELIYSVEVLLQTINRVCIKCPFESCVFYYTSIFLGDRILDLDWIIILNSGIPI